MDEDPKNDATPEPPPDGLVPLPEDTTEVDITLDSEQLSLMEPPTEAEDEQPTVAQPSVDTGDEEPTVVQPTVAADDELTVVRNQ